MVIRRVGLCNCILGFPRNAFLAPNAIADPQLAAHSLQVADVKRDGNVYFAFRVPFRNIGCTRYKSILGVIIKVRDFSQRTASVTQIR